MKFKAYNIYLIIFLFTVTTPFFFSCRKKSLINIQLQEAESLMDTLPDSAYTLLKKVDSIAHFNTSQRAEWNLLVTQAMDKSKIKIQSDSIIREAVTYYENKKDPCKLMLASYYMARVNQSLGDSPLAQKYYLQARENAIHTKDSLYLARINSNIGRLYLYQELPEEAIPYLLETEAYFTQNNDSINIRFATRDLGRAYNLSKNQDNAIEYYKKSLAYAAPTHKSGILNEIVDLYIKTKNYDSAYIYIQEILKAQNTTLSPQSNLVLGQYFANTNQTDSARYYLERCFQTTNIWTRAAASHYLYQMAREQEDWKNYVQFQTTYEDLRDSITEKTHKEELLRLKTLYAYEKKENELIQIKLAQVDQKQKTTLMFAIIFGLSMLLFFFVYQMRQHKRKWKEQQQRWQLLQEKQEKETQEQIDFNNKDIEKLKIELAGKAQNEKELQLQIIRLEQKNNDLRLMVTTKEVFDKDLVTSPLYQKMKDPGNKTFTEDEKQNFITLIDSVYPTFRSSLLQLSPSLTQEDIMVCYLSKAEIPPASAALIMEKSYSNMSNKRARLSESIFGDKKNAKIFDQRIRQIK